MSMMFYQETPYFTGDKIKVLSLIKKELNPETACFYIATMKKVFKNFSWGSSSYNVKIIKNLKIKLPVKNNNEPDYDFMETYIRAIEKSVIKNVVEWKDKVINTTRSICSKKF